MKIYSVTFNNETRLIKAKTVRSAAHFAFIEMGGTVKVPTTAEVYDYAVAGVAIAEAKAPEPKPVPEGQQKRGRKPQAANAKK